MVDNANVQPMNGAPTLSGAEAVKQGLEPPPVVGQRRARIAYPASTPHTVKGRYGRAWKVDLEKIRNKIDPNGLAGPDAVVFHWVIEAPWSHEVIHSYSLIGLHMRALPGKPPMHKYRPDATHEIQLTAIHPQAPRDRILSEPTDVTMWLNPAVYVGQIKAESDAAAEKHARRAVDLVLAGRISPEPNHVLSWVSLFGDSVFQHALNNR